MCGVLSVSGVHGDRGYVTRAVAVWSVLGGGMFRSSCFRLPLCLVVYIPTVSCAAHFLVYTMSLTRIDIGKCRPYLYLTHTHQTYNKTHAQEGRIATNEIGAVLLNVCIRYDRSLWPALLVSTLVCGVVEL